jgi:transcriptional regulator with XRE-family HTH domain
MNDPLSTGGRHAFITGYVFKLARESIPMTQDALAADLGVDRGTIQGWESGRRAFTAVSFGRSVILRYRLAALGAHPRILAALEIAAKADHVISRVLEHDAQRDELDGHPLGWTVMTHAMAEMLAWPITGRTPEILATAGRPSHARRGPVASAPLFTAAESKAFFTSLRLVAERARNRIGSNLLLHRQVCFLSSLDRGDNATEWLTSTRRSCGYVR